MSWLPGRRVTRNEAITAMVLAEACSPAETRERDRMWPFIQGWAAELGLTADHAVTRKGFRRSSGAVGRVGLEPTTGRL